MRNGIIVLGIILLIIGIFLCFTGYSMVNEGNGTMNEVMNEINKINKYNLPIGNMLITLGPVYQKYYYSGLHEVQMGQQTLIFAAIFGVIGLLLIIIIGGYSIYRTKHVKN